MVLKIVLAFQTLKNETSLFDIIPKVLSTQTTRNHENITRSFYLMLKMNTSKNFFPSIARLMCKILIKLNYLQDHELG